MSSQLASIVPKKVVGKRQLRIETLGDVLDGEFNVVEVTARGVNLPNTFTFQAVVRNNVRCFKRVEPESYLALQEVVGGLPILADLAGPAADNIGIVFGEDCYDSIIQGMTLKLRNGLKGTPTIFGSILRGGDRSIPVAVASVHEQLQNFWTLDHLGVTSDEMLERDLELEVKNTIKRNETGKFVVSWPWKPQAQNNLALNKVISETRLRRMVKRMTPEEYTAYDNQLKILLQEGHMELLPRDCIPESYLVKLDRETTKLRIVMMHQPSLRVASHLTMSSRKDQIFYRYCGAYFSASELARSVLWAILRRLFCS